MTQHVVTWPLTKHLKLNPNAPFNSVSKPKPMKSQRTKKKKGHIARNILKKRFEARETERTISFID